MRSSEKIQSGLYIGKVMHMRLRPQRHRFTYRVFSLLLNIDELPSLDKAKRLFGYNRRAIVSFHDKDHGDGTKGGLRHWVEEQLARAGLQGAGMSIYILCYPRIYGYVFNPLTLYFCYDAQGGLRAVLYEVSNTFAERHTYIMRVLEGELTGQGFHQQCKKDFYVSPFLPMDCFYNFYIEPPDEKLLVRIHEEDADGMVLVANFAATRSPINDRTLGLALLRHPLMTLKVSASIYWEALRLWRKGLTIYRHKAAASKVDSTVVSNPTPINQPRELNPDEHH